MITIWDKYQDFNTLYKVDLNKHNLESVNYHGYAHDNCIFIFCYDLHNEVSLRLQAQDGAYVMVDYPIKEDESLTDTILEHHVNILMLSAIEEYLND